MLALGCGFTAASAAANIARILSFESGSDRPGDPNGRLDPDPASRRKRCKSARISAALWYRSPASFSIAFLTMRSSSGGVEGLNRKGQSGTL